MVPGQSGVLLRRNPIVTDLAANRTTVLVDRPPSSVGAFVLYWMIAQRRVTWSVEPGLTVERYLSLTLARTFRR